MLSPTSAVDAEIRAGKNVVGAETKSIESLLHDVAMSGCLGKSERQVALLKYLLTENEAGRGERVKAYSIALDVMERDENFDNSVDSIVRVEMHRLRKNLSLFNARNSNYQIQIPKASYIPLIVEKLKKPNANNLAKSKNITRKKVILFTLILVSLLIISLVGKLLLKRDTAPLTTTFKATISFPNKFNEGAIKNHKEDYEIFANEIQYSLINHQFVNFVTHGATDYHIELQISNPTASGKNISVSVFSSNQSLIWHKDYRQNDQDGKPISLEAVATQVYNTLFSDAGVIIGYHAFNPDISKKHLYLYQCYFDTLTYTLPDAPNFLGPQPLDCLDPELTNLPSDKHLIHMARADIYSGTVNGNFPFNINDAFEKAEAELKLAKQYDTTSVYYLYVKLRLERHRVPRDFPVIKEILFDLDTHHHDNETAQIVMAFGYASLLADWETALPLADKFINEFDGQQSFVNWTYILHFIATEDWESAKLKYELMPPETGNNTLVMTTPVICHTQSTELYDKYSTALLEADLLDKEKFITFMKAKRYHESIEKQMIKPEMFAACPVFQTIEQ